MLKKEKKKKKEKKNENKQEEKILGNLNTKAYQLVIIDGDETHDWLEMFEGTTLNNGKPIHVIQASWLDIEASIYDTEIFLQIAPIRESENKIKKPQIFTCQPDFVLIRNQPRGPTPGSDRTRVLFSLMHAGVESINSLQSEYMNLERPIMFGALKKIKKTVGGDKFPLIKQNFYSSYKQMIINPEFPCIIKVSHAHAGMGKIHIKDSVEFRDLSTVLALHHDYCSAESYIEPQYGIRVQKVGDSYRVFKKIFTGSGWKSQFGGSDLQIIPLTPEYKFWADECAKCFGGMDILAVDAIHSKDGKNYIIELNGTAIGFHTSHWKEDSQVVKDLVKKRMNDLYCNNKN